MNRGTQWTVCVIDKLLHSVTVSEERTNHCGVLYKLIEAVCTQLAFKTTKEMSLQFLLHQIKDLSYGVTVIYSIFVQI